MSQKHQKKKNLSQRNAKIATLKKKMKKYGRKGTNTPRILHLVQGHPQITKILALMTKKKQIETFFYTANRRLTTDKRRDSTKRSAQWKKRTLNIDFRWNKKTQRKHKR